MGFVVDAQAPLLDAAGVEAARLRHAARASLVTENRSVTYAMLATARNTSEPAARQWVKRLRDNGRLITVDHGNYTLIPSYQFDRDYEVIPAVSSTTQVLAGAGMGGWAIWRWFCVVSPWIDDKPVNLLPPNRDHPEALTELAVRFVKDSREG